MLTLACRAPAFDLIYKSLVWALDEKSSSRKRGDGRIFQIMQGAPKTEEGLQETYRFEDLRGRNPGLDPPALSPLLLSGCHLHSLRLLHGTENMGERTWI